MTQLKKHSLLLQLLFAGVSLVFVFLYRHHLTAPDTFNYLFISEELMTGRFYEAVSGHWGILTPVFLVPFLSVGVNGVLAFKLLTWVIGLVTFHLFLRLMERVEQPGWLFILSGLVCMPVLINMSMMLTADLLLITSGLWYFLIISRDRFFDEPKNARFAGLAGALMFFSKSYGLPFFLGHFVIWHILVLIFKKRFRIPGYMTQSALGNPHPALVSIYRTLRWFGNPNLLIVGINGKKIIQSLSHGMSVFLAFSLPWIIVLSLKFGGFTIGTAGKYNLAMSGPERSGLQITKNELIDPGTEFTKLWAYEEPAVFVESWNPFGSKADFNYYLDHLRINTWSIYYIPMIRDLLVVLALLIFGIILFKISLVEQDRVFLFCGILAIAIYTGGYWLLIIRPRYLWLDFLVLMPMVWISLKYLKPLVKPALFGFWAVCIGILILINAFDEFGNRTQNASFFESLIKVENQIPDDLLTGKNVAIIDIPKEQHLMEADAYLLYKKRFRFLGQPFTETLKEKGLQPLKDFPVHYFILWQHDDLAETVFRNEALVFEDSDIQLRIYKLVE